MPATDARQAALERLPGDHPLAGDLPLSLEVHEVPAARVAEALAADIAARLRQALAERGRAVLAVSGGKSPVALFTALRNQPLDWARVSVTLVDERCVPPSHEASNARLVREHLLQGPAAAAGLVALVDAEDAPLPSPQALAAGADAAVRALGPADVVVLGLGEDGHTASLFPGVAGLAEALSPTGRAACVAVQFEQAPAAAPYPRITQTLAQLLTARQLVLPLGGAAKLQVLREALAERSDRLPISHVLHQGHAPLNLWISA